MNFFIDLLKSLFSKKQEHLVVEEIKIQPVVESFPLSIDTTNSKQWKYIIIHHSETANNEVKSWDQIRHYHMSWRYKDDIVSEQKAKELIAKGETVVAPWKDIGYHFGIASNKIMNSFEYLKGRSLSGSGAHTVDFNSSGIGICCLGSFNKTMPTVELYNATKKLVKKLQELYNIPDENVIGHRETYTLVGKPKLKTCPGDLWDCVYFRKLLRGSN